MGLSGLLNIVIALIVIGVFLWAFRKLLALIPMDAWLKQVVDVVVVVIVVIAVVIYVIIPLLHMVAGAVHL